MNLISVAQGLLAIAMLINLAMAIWDVVKREPFNIYYVPSDARLVKSASWFVFVVAGIVSILVIVKVLPQGFFRLYGSCGFSLIIGRQSFIGFVDCSANQQYKSSCSQPPSRGQLEQ